MAGLMSQRKEILLENNIYDSSLDFEKEKKIFQDSNQLNQDLYGKYIDVIDEKKHSLEISNWLELKN